MKEWNTKIVELVDEDVITKEEADDLKYFINNELEQGMGKDYYYHTLYNYHIVSDKIEEPYYYFI